MAEHFASHRFIASDELIPDNQNQNKQPKPPPANQSLRRSGAARRDENSLKLRIVMRSYRRETALKDIIHARRSLRPIMSAWVDGRRRFDVARRETTSRDQVRGLRADNAASALFCTRCTAPLSVVPLSNLTDRDQQTCLAALYQVLADAIKTDHNHSPIADESLWRAYLSAFWLRPETALILYAEALAIRQATKNCSGPWLDLGCGDGIHAALYSGWKFAETFDAFQSLDPSAADMYHHWNPADFSATVLEHGKQIDHGVDIKDTAISRANSLRAFAKVQQADATKLPLADKSIGIIFSNMLRDLGDPLPGALKECRRVMKDDGSLLISAMTPQYAKHLHFAPLARKAEAEGETDLAREMLRLDRGRSVFCQRQLSIDDWEALLNEQGLKVVDVRPIVGPAIIRFWDIGLRPFAVQLLKQRQSWNQAGLLPAIKPGIVNFLARSLEPLVRQLNVGQPCMNLLTVKKL